MNNFPHLAQRVLNTPVAIRPEKAEVIIAVLAERLGVTSMTRLSGQVVAMEDYDDYMSEETRRGYSANYRGYDIVNDMAIVQIRGTLVQKSGSLRPESGMTGYDGIRENLLQALADPAVKGIVLDVDSPGGEVAGCFDLADTIYAARSIKPSVAICNEVAFSAAYALASAAGKVYVPRTGGLGSIGVVWCHVDLSKALTAAGLNVTFVQYGKRKTDGNQLQPLAPEALDNIQGQIDGIGEIFVASVARNRNLPVDKVRDTEAACFSGAEGVALGLGDAVMAPDGAFRQFCEELA